MSNQTSEIEQPILSKEAIRGAIQYECRYTNNSIRNIAAKFKVSPKTVMKWKKRDFVADAKKTRTPKLKSKHIEYIRKLADGKYTGIDQASSRMIASSLERKFNKNLKKITFSICHSTVNKVLNKILSKPRKSKQTFKLSGKNKDSRINFIKWIKENKVKGNDIFFTDESRFLLDTPLNPQTNQIRFNKEDIKKLRDGDQELYER
jgi:transposase